MRILGIDPGLRKTGFGVIETQGTNIVYITSGTIVVPVNIAMSERLKVIFDNIHQVINDTKPSVASIEIIFMNTNPSTTLLLGQARGAAFCSIAHNNLPAYEYTALQIKKSIVGTGRAVKKQMQIMVQHLLSLNGMPSADSADALACAICHAHVNPLQNKISTLKNSLTLPSNRKLKNGRIIM
ncbi:crossover junction endodeoxyribonuclease RuvC [Candidatus Kinetoplastibacterium desouzaii TCC079E]|uniref:Crossover junction endodeoxyribonuclease RuvC n=1 Tax=Candidatus Kinetoplastidibacterium desouzai TCC079E TaxID=1208919 RepID=M1M4F0_9PROT|nr:crossover junction endodeoxyribonuclease RuvC [Candidatus Kinetoplastibacterium desouzaii]AGF47090.1 crossover junction endodeoxyribonuclease RuvC [Candidatus Kinetoplastibacterium desouzaii TCC079E]